MRSAARARYYAEVVPDGEVIAAELRRVAAGSWSIRGQCAAPAGWQIDELVDQREISP